MAWRRRVRGVVLAAVCLSAPVLANAPTRGPEIAIARAAGPITVDGDLSDAGWQGAVRVDTWYETNPGDNVPPRVKNVAYLAYDDRALYAGFVFEDPHPSDIRAPLGDRDNVPSYTDYAGIILDTRNDGRTGILLLSNPRGIQYDAVSDDASGNEDSSPDFYWDSAGRITATGWTLEIRVPFSSLRYPKGDPQTWGILLYRNWPRDFRRQMFAGKLPRGENCFICHSNPLTGLAGLPSGGHLVVAPYVSGTQESVPRGDPGSDLVHQPVDPEAGVDLKWTPSEAMAIDAAFNPDFSQVESDVAQIATNERFALFYPEKRPFFLEGVELFTTPIQAVYTRTITSPRWGLRATGKLDSVGYTALVAKDRGGGSVILPGANSSDFADQDFSSLVAVGRGRVDLGPSFASYLLTDREIEGGGYNRVFGPDFQWNPSANDRVTGQLLVSATKTPDRPDLADEWNGGSLFGHAADVWYSHSSSTWDWFAEYKDFGDAFRADLGFVPQVGYREVYGEPGYTFRPTKGPVSRLRLYVQGDYQAERDGALIFRMVSPGFGLDAVKNTFLRVRWSIDKVRAGDEAIDRSRLVYTLQTSPSRFVSQIVLDGDLGEQIDFANARPGHGGRVNLSATLRPGDHLALQFNGEHRWLDVKRGDSGSEERLFTADVARLKATYTFSARSFLRLIGQWIETKRDPSLYTSEVSEREGAVSASALFAYKLNWQTVLFLGYGDERALSGDEHYEVANRQLFLKVSYAFQR